MSVPPKVEDIAPPARCRAAHPLLLVQCDRDDGHSAREPYHSHTQPNGTRCEWHADDISPLGCLVSVHFDEHQAMSFVLGSEYGTATAPEMTAFAWRPDPQPTPEVLAALSAFSTRMVDAVIAREDLPPGDAEQPQPARPPLARMFAAVMRAWVHYSQALFNVTDEQIREQLDEARMLERQHVATYLEDGWARRAQSLPEIALAIVNGQHVPSSMQSFRATPATPCCTAGAPLTARATP